MVDVSCNQVTSLKGLSQLVALRTLLVSDNPLKSFESISEIRHLPAITEIAFQSPMHVQCRVCEIPGYKDYVLSQLPQVHKLDGVLIQQDQI